MPDALTEERLRWIRALESGQYRKGVGALCGPVPATEFKSGEGYGWCCIGVWYAVHGETEDLEELKLTGGWNNDGDYDAWMRATQAESSLNDYLVAMNDGAPLKAFGGSVVRNGLPRSHPFIARFLRKVWRLTDAG